MQAKCQAIRTFSACLAANPDAQPTLRTYLSGFLEFKLFESNCSTFTQVT